MMTVLGCCILPASVLLLLPLAWLESGGSRKGLLPVTLCAFLAAYGMFAYLAQAGGLCFVGQSFEWPLLSTAGSVENARGQRFVPLVAPGRIQVYDREGEFLRGWFVDTCGGVFRLQVTQDDDLEVFTSRGRRRFVFASDGTLLAEGYRREDYDQLPAGPACRFDHRCAWYLWPLAHPLLALLPCGAGLAGLAVLFTHPRLRGVPRRRIANRGPTTIVSSEGPGAFSMVVGMAQELSSAQVSVRTADNELHSVSHNDDLAAIGSDCLRNPPSGTWYAEETSGFSLGASTRSPLAFFLVPFMCVWSAGALGGVYGSQFAFGEFNLVMSLFGIPFVIASAVFWTLALMTVCGRVVVTVNDRVGTVFLGIGSWGWTRSFDWSDVSVIREEGTGVCYPGGCMGAILLEGATRLKFGTNLNEERRYFLLTALKYLKARSG